MITNSQKSTANVSKSILILRIIGSHDAQECRLLSAVHTRIILYENNRTLLRHSVCLAGGQPMHRVFQLPVLGIYGNFTRRSSVSSVPVVLVSLFATVDAATEGVLAQVIPLQGRRRLTALPLLLDQVIGRLGALVHLLLVVAQQIGVPRRPRRSLRRLLLRCFLLAHERNVTVDYIVLHVRRSVVVGLCQLRGQAAARAFVFPLSAGGAQFAHQFPEGFANLVLGVAAACEFSSICLLCVSLSVQLVEYLLGLCTGAKRRLERIHTRFCTCVYTFRNF